MLAKQSALTLQISLSRHIVGVASMGVIFNVLRDVTNLPIVQMEESSNNLVSVKSEGGILHPSNHLHITIV